MRVNSSPSSLIGPVASYHVSAQLPLPEHPQKPRVDVPTLQGGFVPQEPLGVPAHPTACSSRGAHPGTLALRGVVPPEGAAFLRLILHENALISSTDMLYFYYRSSNRFGKARGHSDGWWQVALLWLGCWGVLHVPPPHHPGIQQGGKGKKREEVKVMKKRRQNPLPKRPKTLVNLSKN